MKRKSLVLKKETLSRLGGDELAEVVAGTGTTFTCAFTGGESCGGVCSGYCPTFSCAADELIRTIRTAIG